MLPGKKTLFDVLPFDVCQFLVYKDGMGKTQPHRNECQYTDRRGVSTCGCPRRLTYVTVDSYIGKLRNGIGPSIWAIPPQMSLLSYNLSRFPRSNYRPGSHQNKQHLSFQISCCYFPGTWKGLYCFLTSLPRNCLFSYVIKPFSNVCFTLGTAQVTWAR